MKMWIQLEETKFVTNVGHHTNRCRFITLKLMALQPNFAIYSFPWGWKRATTVEVPPQPCANKTIVTIVST